MNFGTIILYQSMETGQNYAIQILILLQILLTSNDVKKWFDTSNCDKSDKRPLPIGKNKKVLGFLKDELGGKMITEFVALRPKAYSYLHDYGKDHKKLKIQKSVL